MIVYSITISLFNKNMTGTYRRLSYSLWSLSLQGFSLKPSPLHDTLGCRLSMSRSHVDPTDPPCMITMNGVVLWFVAGSPKFQQLPEHHRSGTNHNKPKPSRPTVIVFVLVSFQRKASRTWQVVVRAIAIRRCRRGERSLCTKVNAMNGIDSQQS